MRSWKIPGFTAEASFSAAGRAFSCGLAAPASLRDNATAAGSMVVPAQTAPGGPSTVPSGYGRDCKRVPYTVCDVTGCRTEYGWVCVYYPLPRVRSSGEPRPQFMGDSAGRLARGAGSA